MAGFLFDVFAAPLVATFRREDEAMPFEQVGLHAGSC
jgi:hypothetical protein